jgi:pilus assembly protein CpaB
MRRETLMVGIIAVIAALGTAGALRFYLAEGPPEDVKPPKQPPKFRVLLAGTDLPADRVVSKDDIVGVQMTQKEFSKKFKGMGSEQAILTPSGVINRRLKEPIKHGQPFWTTKFYLDGTGPSVAKKLQPGYRAIRVNVPNTREAGVQAGMFVDVMFRSKPRPKGEGKVGIPEKTVTLMRHIEVIEAEPPRRAQEKVDKKPLLFTLAVPDDKADVFGIIEGRGEVWLVPTPAGEKGSADDDKTIANASTLAQLLGIKPPKKPPAPFVTAIYRRGKVHLNKFVNGKKIYGRPTGHRVGESEKSAPTVPGASPPAVATSRQEEPQAGEAQDDAVSGEKDLTSAEDESQEGSEEQDSAVFDKENSAASGGERSATSEQEQ